MLCIDLILAYKTTKYSASSGNLVIALSLYATLGKFKVSTSATGAISEALISPGPFASKISFFVPSELHFNASDLTFKTISVTSSLTPFIEVNSCKTPSICTDVTASPLI